jgi:very-short-patch-repair endonuclease
MLPIANLRADSVDMVVAAMADPCPQRTGFALRECDRLFERARTPHEALLVPALGIWSALTGGDVRCRESLPRFGRVGGFLIERRLVIECDGPRRSVARDQALQSAGYAVRRFALAEMRADDVRRELHAAFDALKVH